MPIIIVFFRNAVTTNFDKEQKEFEGMAWKCLLQIMMTSQKAISNFLL